MPFAGSMGSAGSATPAQLPCGINCRDHDHDRAADARGDLGKRHQANPKRQYA